MQYMSGTSRARGRSIKAGMRVAQTRPGKRLRQVIAAATLCAAIGVPVALGSAASHTVAVGSQALIAADVLPASGLGGPSVP
jgi:hypothetical protein